MLEIIIQGRGGQGAQTAGNMLAHAFFREGREVQSFATYGGARRGTPVTSMIRVDVEPIRMRCDIEVADAILCFDRTLLDARLLDRARSDALILVNGPGPSPDIPADGVRFVDAAPIAGRHDLGRVVNSVLLGAFCRLLGSPSLESLCRTVFRAAPRKREGNVAACRAGYGAVAAGGVVGRTASEVSPT